MQKKKSGSANSNRAWKWNLLRLGLLWARKGGVFKHGLLLHLRLFPKFLKTSLIGQSSTQRAAFYYGERELSFDDIDTPIIRFKMRRPSSLRFQLPHIPCINPQVDFECNFDFDDNNDFCFSPCKNDKGSKSFSGVGGDDDDDDENCEVCEDDEMNSCEDEGVDAKAEQFIAKFYEQIKMQRQVSYLQYYENRDG